MDIQGRRRSSNIEDRRGQTPVGATGGSGCSPMMIYLLLNLMRTKVGRIIVLILVVGGLAISLLGNQLGLFDQGIEPRGRVEDRIDYNNSANAGNVDSGPADNAKERLDGKYGQASDEELVDYLKVVLADLEDVWGELFQNHGMTYQEPTLVFYSGYVQSACGLNSSQTGPFYCPADGKVYIDVSFFRELSRKYGASGDFAIAYVLAHEVGHHVQNLLGISEQVHNAQRRSSEKEINRLSVRLELQADYFAGVWAHYAKQRNLLDVGDIEEAIQAAQAIGDDRLQKQARGFAVPDSFTHGTSKQRSYWFDQGVKQGSIEYGNQLFNLGYEQLRLR